MSEFGKGFTYCIGLFLAHAERDILIDDYGIWFNGAADHLYELEIPEVLAESVKTEIGLWQDFCIECRMRSSVTKKDRDSAIADAKRFLMIWDAECGIETEKGDWE